MVINGVLIYYGVNNERSLEVLHWSIRLQIQSQDLLQGSLPGFSSVDDKNETSDDNAYGDCQLVSNHTSDLYSFQDENDKGSESYGTKQ